MVTFDTKDIASLTDTNKLLVHDEEYYRYIFKKTEKIVSVVFYILHNVPENSKNSLHIKDIQTAAQKVHDQIIVSLETPINVSEEKVREAALSLVALESKLRVAYVAGLLNGEIMHLFSSEIDTVLRAMNRYMNPDHIFDLGGNEASALQSETKSKPKARQKETSRPSTPKPTTETAENRESQSSSKETSDRRERIKTILEAKGNASIKDISEIVTDCSEKTIQRELNSMIEEGVIKRHGKRRWSTYSVA